MTVLPLAPRQPLGIRQSRVVWVAPEVVRVKAKRCVQGVQPTLAIAFAEGLREEVATLRQVGAAKGWGVEYTECMITKASSWLEKDRRD